MNGANQRVNGNIKEINRTSVIQKRDEVAHNADKGDCLGGFAAKASAGQTCVFIRRNSCFYAKGPAGGDRRSQAQDAVQNLPIRGRITTGLILNGRVDK